VFRCSIRLFLVFVVCAIAGCGSGSGIEPGMPADAPTTPVNPTPDMGPTPPPTQTPGDAKTK
jgi:hypothetical protein